MDGHRGNLLFCCSAVISPQAGYTMLVSSVPVCYVMCCFKGGFFWFWINSSNFPMAGKQNVSQSRQQCLEAIYEMWYSIFFLKKACQKQHLYQVHMHGEVKLTEVIRIREEKVCKLKKRKKYTARGTSFLLFGFLRQYRYRLSVLLSFFNSTNNYTSAKRRWQMNTAEAAFFDLIHCNNFLKTIFLNTLYKKKNMK